MNKSLVSISVLWIDGLRANPIVAIDSLYASSGCIGFGIIDLRGWVGLNGSRLWYKGRHI